MRRGDGERSRRRVRDLVARLAFQGLSENEIGRARISMMARNANVPFKGRIQKRKTYHLQIITFRLQRAAGPYSRAINGPMHCNKRSVLFGYSITPSVTASSLRGTLRPSARAVLRLMNN